MNELLAHRARLVAVVAALAVSISLVAAFVVGRIPTREPGEMADLSAVGLALNEGVQELLQPIAISDPTAPTETTFDWYRIRGVAAEGSRIKVYRDRDRDGIPDFVAPLGMTAVAPGTSEFVVQVPLEVGEHLLMLTVTQAGDERIFLISAITRIAVKDSCECLPGLVSVLIARGATIESVLEGIAAADVTRAFADVRTLEEGGSLEEDRVARRYHVTVAPGSEHQVIAQLRRNPEVVEVRRVEVIPVG